jgi:hypothetical protein
MAGAGAGAGPPGVSPQPRPRRGAGGRCRCRLSALPSPQPQPRPGLRPGETPSGPTASPRACGAPPPAAPRRWCCAVAPTARSCAASCAADRRALRHRANAATHRPVGARRAARRRHRRLRRSGVATFATWQRRDHGRGQGTRMKSALPKVLHRLAGRPLLQHVLDAAAAWGGTPVQTVVITGHGADEVEAACAAMAAPCACTCARCRSWAPATRCSRRCRSWTRLSGPR